MPFLSFFSRRRTLLFLLLWLSAPVAPLAAQQRAYTLRFSLLAGQTPVLPDGRYVRLPGAADSFRIDVFRCYLSHIRLLRGGEVVFTDTAPTRLLDLGDSGSLSIRFAAGADLRCDEIRFLLGIDSATNAAGAGSGPLDPVNGMYWAWQSGYINLKLEGVSPACPARKNRFQFHLGGFREGQYCARAVALPLSTGDTAAVFIRVDRFLRGIDLRSGHTVMTPGAGAVELSERAAAMFTTEAGAP